MPLEQRIYTTGSEQTPQLGLILNRKNTQTPMMGAYLEGLERAGELETDIGAIIGGLLPMAGPIIQGITSLFGGGGGGGGGGAPANPFTQALTGALGGGAAGGLGPLSNLLGALGGGASGGGKGGGIDPAAALLAAQSARTPSTDPAVAATLNEVAQKGRQETQAKQAAEEVKTAVSPELNAIKSQVEELSRAQRERERVQDETRSRRFQELTLQKLNALLAAQTAGARERLY